MRIGLVELRAAASSYWYLHWCCAVTEIKCIGRGGAGIRRVDRRGHVDRKRRTAGGGRDRKESSDRGGRCSGGTGDSSVTSRRAQKRDGGGRARPDGAVTGRAGRTR